LLGPWRARRQRETSSSSSSSSSGWLPATVPSTALALLVQNGLLPDPAKDENVLTIPDVFHAGRDYYTFWWCTSFDTPRIRARPPRRREACGLGRWLGLLRLRRTRPPPPTATPASPYVQVLLEGANYGVSVHVNGVSLLSGAKGMFLRRVVEVPASALAETSANELAILVEPPDHVGCVDLGGQGGDHMIAKDVTSQYVEGWDWIQPMPDRNTGLWGSVRLQMSGPALLSDPRVRVTFRKGAESGAQARLTVGCRNLSQETVRVVIRASARPRGQSRGRGARGPREGQQWAKTVELGARQVAGEFDLGQQSFEDPMLWFPLGHGEQNLYELRVSVSLAQTPSEVSHQVSTTFGFRSLESAIDPRTRSRQFTVNGVPIFVRGGNYIVPDAMLRCDRERCWTEVRHHAEMGLNMIRLWGGAGVPYAEFYEACDFFGIMVWSEFWITGDCDGRGATKDSPESNPDWPLDHQLFLECACDVIKKLRNHPSVVLWCGGNEQVPCKELDDGLRALVGEKGSLDDSRPYVSGSLWGGFGQGGGDWSDGPYGIQNESDFWSDSFYPYGFNPELGSVGVPCAESIRTMFTKPGDQNPPKFVKNADGTVTEVVPKSWEFHKYITYTTSSGRSKILSYGEPENLDEYCQRAQIVNFTQYKALAEAWGSRMWTKYTGMLIWKTANPWTSLRGQMYDTYLNPTGAYFGVKQCCGDTCHVQCNPVEGNAFEVVNMLRDPVAGAKLEVETVSCADNARKLQSFDLDEMPALRTTRLSQGIPSCRDGVLFSKLRLLSAAGKVLSRNVYWLAPQGADDFTSLKDWGKRKVGLVAEISRPSTWVFHAKLRNPSACVAFFVSLKVVKGKQVRDVNDLLLPVYYSENYITLFPGESLGIDVDLGSVASPRHDLEGVNLLVEGWNVDPFSVPLTPNNPLFL